TGDADAAADAGIALAGVVGLDLARTDEGLLWLALARANATRAGMTAVRDAALLSGRSRLESARGNRDAALALAKDALETLEEVDAAPDLRAQALERIGAVYVEIRDFRAAEGPFRRA